MMLNYNNVSLQKLTGISFSIGQVVENGIGGNTTANVVLSKLNNGQEADQLGITYTSDQGEFTMVIFRQRDGRYIFSYRGGVHNLVIQTIFQNWMTLTKTYLKEYAFVPS